MLWVFDTNPIQTRRCGSFFSEVMEMPRNGSGVYSKPANATATAGTKIESAHFNTLIDDIAADLNAARPVVAGGTGVTSIAAFKTACNLVIGTDIQAYNADLTAIAGLTSAADSLPYFTGSGTASLADLSPFGRTLIDDPSAANARTTLELETIGQAEAEAGTATTTRAFTAQRVKQAIMALAGGGGIPSAVVEDQKPSGTAGGTNVKGAWATRVLNTKIYDPDSLVTLASNQVTVTNDGWIEWESTFQGTGETQTRLFNVTDAVVAGAGTSFYSTTSNIETTIHGGGSPVLAGKVYRVEYRAGSVRSSTGLGNDSDYGTEVYTRVRYWSS